MSRRRLVLALAPMLALAAERAEACSCVSYLGTPSVDRCLRAGRAFAGTIGAYEWPFPHERDPDVRITLEVDTVWRGEVPRTLVATTNPGCCACGVTPTPGLRFYACDDGVGDEVLYLSSCAPPGFGAPPEALVAALGDATPPREAAARVALGERLAKHVYLLIPLAGTLVGAGVGRLIHRLRPRARARRSSTRTIVALLVLAAMIFAARVALLLEMPIAETWTRMRLTILGTLLLATLVGLFLGARGQRSPARHGGGLRGLALALFGVAIALYAGLGRLHAPIQAPGSLECSKARARELARTLPKREDQRDDDGVAYRRRLKDAFTPAPRSCTDWGLGRFEIDLGLPAIGFEDGQGGVWALPLEGDGSFEYGEELPR